jgi:putative hydrolase of the HAD superfamily
MKRAGETADRVRQYANDSAFDHVESWVFDLDNTLYSPRCALFTQIDTRMGEFISRLFDIDAAAARRIQKQYYRDYGTTLRGLMSEHRIDPRAFLDYVHDIDLSTVAHDAALVAALAALPGRKFIHTNATTAHAERVATRIGLLDHVDHIFDIEAADYVPKPARETYVTFVGQYGIDPRKAAIFEDLERNLEAPAELGMTTVLVKPDGHPHPDAEFSWAVGRDNEGHIHHVTYDLAAFLGAAMPRQKDAIEED